MTDVVRRLRPSMDAVVVGDDHATLTRRHAFRVLKAEDGHITEAAELLVTMRASRCLSTVLEHFEPMLACHTANGADVSRSAAHVDRKHDGRARRDLPRKVPRVHVVRLVDL